MYHGYRPQLFDLLDDPYETRDLAGIPGFAAVRDVLSQQRLADWDPEGIRPRMEQRRRDKDLLAVWANFTNPANHYVWEVHPDQNRLDTPGLAGASGA